MARSRLVGMLNKPTMFTAARQRQFVGSVCGVTTGGVGGVPLPGTRIVAFYAPPTMDVQPSAERFGCGGSAGAEGSARNAAAVLSQARATCSRNGWIRGSVSASRRRTARASIHSTVSSGTEVSNERGACARELSTPGAVGETLSARPGWGGGSVQPAGSGIGDAHQVRMMPCIVRRAWCAPDLGRAPLSHTPLSTT